MIMKFVGELGPPIATPSPPSPPSPPHWLDQVIQAGRAVGKSSGTDGEHSSDDEIQKDRACCLSLYLCVVSDFA